MSTSSMTDPDLMLRFMLQVLVVLATCSAVGWFGHKYLGQAQVTMEMLTGVILGPSVFGALSPPVQQALFPPFMVAGSPTSGKHPSMTVLYVVGQIGIILYIFLIGLDFDLNVIKSRSKQTIAVSVAGILGPILLGMVVFYTILNSRTDLFGAGISPSIQALFVASAMSITAFPMLARIIDEAGIKGSPLGTLIIGAGASNDVFAWALLAIVLAITKGNPMIAVFAIGGSIVFSALLISQKEMLFGFLDRREPADGISPSTISIILLLLFLGAWCTDSIGVHALFGSFLVGVAIPRGRLGKLLREKIEPLTISFFLPFFFVYSGLNTQIGSLEKSEHWILAILLLLAAVVGKIGGCFLAAKACGETVRTATGIGVLMNTRGLMELIVLNIGLQQKIITPTFFTMMVIMAIVTTFMAAPLFRMVYKGGRGEPKPS